jgi:hypothetical protein
METMQPEEQNTQSSDKKDASHAAIETEANGKKDQKADDNVQSSSTGSDGGKGGGSGSGSGGGYSADCSSSDASSLEAAKGSIPDKGMARLSVDGDGNSAQESSAKASTSNKGPKSSAQKKQNGSRRGNDQTETCGTCGTSALKPEDLASECDSDSQWNLAVDAMHSESSLPQWNGVRVFHPMDPRIDISTVGHIQESVLSAFPSPSDKADLPGNSEQEDKESAGDNPSESSEPPPPPSIDQYMKLMEVINH